MKELSNHGNILSVRVALRTFSVVLVSVVLVSVVLVLFCTSSWYL